MAAGRQGSGFRVQRWRVLTRPLLAALAVLLFVPGLTKAGDSDAAAGKKFNWRPVRPSEQRALDRDERETRTDRSVPVRRAPSVHVDARVKPAVLQQAADPLRNPFDDPIPRSPFSSAARQAEPMPEATSAPSADSTAPDSAEPSTSSPAVNDPFATDSQAQDAAPQESSTTTSQPIESPEPGRLLEQELSPPTIDDPTGGSPLQGLTPPEEAMVPTDPKQDCDRALARFKANRLSAVTSRGILDLSLPRGEDGSATQPPFECNLGTERFSLDSGREWAQTCYTWKASGLCHKPLYFEQSHMERYGHSWGPVLDPVVSGAHFFASVPLLPYKMGVEPPCECIYPLGHYRPGNCAPHYIEPWPWSIRGAALQATAVTGLIYAVP